MKKQLVAGIVLGAATCSHAALVTFNSPYGTGGLEAASSNAFDTKTSKYSVVAGGLNSGSGTLQAVDIINSDTNEPDDTATYSTAFDPAAGAITVSSYFRKKADSSITLGNGLQLGLSSAATGSFLTTSGAYLTARFSATATDAFVLQTQSWTGSGSASTVSQTSSFSLTNGNWYYFETTITKAGTSNDFTVAGVLKNSDISGTLGTTVSSFAAQPIANSGLYSDTTTFGGFRAANLNAVDLVDNFSIGQVPEPATLGLIGLGGLFLRRRRA